MMLRFRRYRVFLALALISFGLLYQFKSLGNLESASLASVESLKKFGSKHNPISHGLHDETAGVNAGRFGEKQVPAPGSASSSSQAFKPGMADDIKQEMVPSRPISQSNTASTVSGNGFQGTGDAVGKQISATSPLDTDDAASKADESPSSSALPNTFDRLNTAYKIQRNASKIHWSRIPEHFPLPTESIINLPTGTPKPMPRIQHRFGSDSSMIAETEKLDVIREAFRVSWDGYRKYAWTKDELAPVSGEWHNGLCGWGATLVDTLDTLWIMDMKTDFEEAVEAVRLIDFTTTTRNDIPLFETVIRYLGGLIAAYDISGAAYRVLLEKAIELADILMGAFDTPNRMPLTFYLWKPAFASQPHRARTRVVLAELASLSLEFTRLAQLTGQSRYYDAIARITNELEAWQNSTQLPGLWPLSIDASGCKKPETSTSTSLQKGINGESMAQPRSVGGRNGDGDNDPQSSPGSDRSRERALDSSFSPSPRSGSDLRNADCEPQRLASPPYTSTEDFTLGSMADSAYEYLPKQYLLLGGLEPKYRTMYEAAASVASLHVLYRPMIPDETRNILQVGRVLKSRNVTEEASIFRAEGSHLSCFAGGMYGMGSKIFGLDGDLEIARRLTDGCIWAYEATNTGIMPEEFLSIACTDQTKCPWNETLWLEKLDPYRQQRELRGEGQEMQKVLTDHKQNEDSTSPLSNVADLRSGSADTLSEASHGDDNLQLKATQTMNLARSGPSDSIGLQRRQLGKSVAASELGDATSIVAEAVSSKMATETETHFDSSMTVPALSKTGAWSPTLETQSAAIDNDAIHEEFAATRIRNERLPIGMTSVTRSKYILRPEAIESVFIMYRLTGENYWREKGWQMFTAIQNHTTAKFGASAISDVTSRTSRKLDSMESFWLSETLKYFYLLFSDPTLVNLDEYVLNTEAHPFLRPI